MKPIPLGRGLGTTSSRSNRCGSKEQLLLFASRLYYSRLYSCFYVLMIIINTGLLIGLGLLHLADPVEFPMGIMLLEVVVTTILLLEVLGRMCSQGRLQFFSSWCNLLDSGVVLLCVGSTILFLSLPNNNDLEEAVATVLMVCRYGVHFIRVLMMLKLTTKQQSLRGRNRTMDVKFEKLAHNDEDDDDEDTDDFGMAMVALGGFDDFEDYSNRVNSILGHVEEQEPISQFDQLYAKHIQGTKADSARHAPSSKRGKESEENEWSNAKSDEPYKD